MRLRSPMASTSRLRLISPPALSRASSAHGAGDVVSLAPLGTDARFASTLAAARSGDEQAVAALYRLLHPRVLRFLRVVRPSEAAELASATWIAVVAELPRFRGDEAALVALALTIAYRSASDRPRRPRRRDRRERAPAPAQLDGLADLGALPRARAEVLLLRVLGGMSVDEVAEVTGRGRGTVRILQRLALRALSRKVGRGGGSR